MKQTFSILIILINGLLSLGQNFRPTSQSNNSFNIDDFLSGVKYARILTTPENEQTIRDNPEITAMYSGVIQFLQSMGFEKVGLYSSFTNTPSSFCDIANVYVSSRVLGSYILDFTIVFSSCNGGDEWTFKSKERISIQNGIESFRIYNALIKMYGYKKPNYNAANRIKLKSEITSWTETKLKSHFVTNGIDALEGIYENTSADQAKYKLCVIKNSEGYDIIYLSGADNYLDWDEGDIKAKLTPTATQSMFKADWYTANKKKESGFYASFETGLMNVYYPDNSKDLYLKLYPISSDKVTPSNNLPASGTGFAISNNGLIVTNEHVINGASKIKVRGVNNDFNKTYNAKIIIADINNDLAIIQIDDPSFTTFGNLPYIINNRSSDVGSSIFVLGYPLRASMGDEVKLTNGIISSKSGFQGDVTSYQITAAVQPGNSGGPLFDEKGNIIGIVNAKLLGAENASYAIKSSYLFNLVDLIPNPPTLQSISTVAGKSLTEQVKILKKYTYIIEIN